MYSDHDIYLLNCSFILLEFQFLKHLSGTDPGFWNGGGGVDFFNVAEKKASEKSNII